MTYVAKGGLVFGLRDKLFPDCCIPRAKRSDGRLKRFPSIYDDRVWSIEERERYRYLYDLMSGSQTCLSRFSCFKYVPLEALVKLLLAERDAYIRCLEHRLGIVEHDDASTSGVTAPSSPPKTAAPVVPSKPTTVVQTPRPSGPVETPVNEIFKAGAFVDEEEQDTIALKNKIACLIDELEECKCTRDTLREAMHKLENIDEIVNENESLKGRLRCSEEMIKYLEERKSILEKELENLRTKSQIQMDLREAQEMLLEVGERERISRKSDLGQLAQERDYLQARVEELQAELNQARTRQSELDLLRKQSESASMSLEEITRENECYKKKLASMRDLEKQIEELKKQAKQIADKYRRDSVKACDQDKQMQDLCRELRSLREERDRLKRRVDELACYEEQYKSLQNKLKQVDNILAENAMLNCKLECLDKLEAENQFLKCKLEECQASEMEAAESKDKIIELENAVADQEEEMKDLLCQIERLTRTYGDSSELDRLKEELCKKECKLRLCEEQLAEIPLLEAEVDELRCKLENCCNNIAGNPEQPVDELSSEIEERTTVIDGRYEEPVAFEESTAVCTDILSERTQILEKMDSEKTMTCEEIQDLLQSSKGIITCVLEDMIEHQKEMEELVRCNREMKDEIGTLKAKMCKTEVDEIFEEMSELKRLLRERDKKICCLEGQLAKSGDLGKVNDHISSLEREIECLKDLNRKMRSDLQEACCEVQRCTELECLLEEEKRARCAAEAAARQGESRTKSQKEVYNIEAKESFTSEVDALRSRIECLNKLVEELREENEMLKKVEQGNPDYGKEMEERANLENLLNVLQCKLDACRDEKDSDETKALRCEMDRLKDQNCQLRSLVNCYKERLELERCSNEANSSRASSAGAQEENKKLKLDLARMQNELIELCNRLDECEKMRREKAAEFNQLLECYKNLAKKNDEMEEKLKENENERKSSKEVWKIYEETNNLLPPAENAKNRTEEAKKPEDRIEEGRKPEVRIQEAMKPEDRIDEGKKPEDRIEEGRKPEVRIQEAIKPEDGIEEGKKPEDRIGEGRKPEDRIGEGRKPEVRIEEAKKPDVRTDYETDKKAIESVMRNVEEEVDDLTVKLEERGKAEQERNNLLMKQGDMEAELEKLRKQLKECKQSGPEQKVEEREEKLLEEMVGMREQAEKFKAENKKLKDELDELRNLLEKCKKANTNEEAQASLMSSKQEGTSYPVQPAAKAVPQTVIPIKEEQRASVLERGQQEAMKQPERASVIDPTPKEIKVVVEDPTKTVRPPCGGVSDESIVSFSDLDPGYAKFVCTLNPFDHRQNVCQIDRRYKEMMADLKRKNDEKVKKLVDQQKKESIMRDKTFNETMTSMRSGYESDIRKLIDRHKGSILRLQNLHEDEVRQLNENYERQLQALQLQNENVVSDLSSGAAKKFKSLAEQHNRDLRELETKYQKLLQDKEEEYARSVGGRDDGADAGSKYERELKRMKKSNLKRVELMQQKYEKLLACERKKYERQLEETIKKLKQGKGVSDGICQCRCPVPGEKDPDAPLEFNHVLQKILTHGLESLSFNEVALVHRRTCAATGDIVLNPEMTANLQPAIAEDNGNRDVKENREELLNRILVLENEIAIKQIETQDAIVNMELAVKAESQRLQQLRESLKQEQEKNPDLKSNLPSMSIISTPPRRASPRFHRPMPPKLHCMPPIKVEDIVPGSRPPPKSPGESHRFPDRTQVIMDKIKELAKERCLCPRVIAEKDTTAIKHKKSSGKDSKTTHKVTAKKKGKK